MLRASAKKAGAHRAGRTSHIMSMSIATASAPVISQSQSTEQAKLNQLLAQYRADLKSGSSGSLASIGREITAQAKLLGQNVTLPSASASAAATVPLAPASGLSITA